MPIGADSINVRPPTPIEASSAAATIGEVRQEIYQRALQRIVGQPLQGQVLSRYTDGSFLVKVADTAARVILPAGAQVGDSVGLTLISLQPRPTFLLGADSGGKLDKTPLVYLDPHGAAQLGSEEAEPPTAIGNKAQLAQLVYLAQQNTAQSGTKSGAGSASVNNAGQLVDTFIQSDGLVQGNGRLQAGQLGPTLQAAPQAAAAALAAAQKDSAPASLSNAARLINNVLQAAQQEGAPTALLGKSAIVPSPASVPQQVALALHDTLAYSGLFYESHVQEWADGKRPITELLREPQMQAQTADAGNSQKANADQVQFPQLVNLQLNALEQQSTHWRGEIWPGQQMEWDVRKEESKQGQSGGGGDADQPQQSWQSAVRFNLPTLGAVSATIHLIGEHLHIQVSTGSEATASALRDHAQSLADALGAAGSPLDSLLVKQDDHA